MATGARKQTAARRMVDLKRGIWLTVARDNGEVFRLLPKRTDSKNAPCFPVFVRPIRVSTSHPLPCCALHAGGGENRHGGPGGIGPVLTSQALRVHSMPFVANAMHKNGNGNEFADFAKHHSVIVHVHEAADNSPFAPSRLESAWVACRGIGWLAWVVLFGALQGHSRDGSGRACMQLRVC